MTRKSLLILLSTFVAFSNAQMLELDQLEQVIAESQSNESLSVDNQYDFNSFNQSEYTNIVSQISNVRDFDPDEYDFQKNIDAQIELAAALCARDPNACNLIENYRNYSDENRAASDREPSVFGIEFFMGYPISFNQTSSGGIPEDYSISIGDNIAVMIVGTGNIRANVYVDQQGIITIPRVGVLQVFGKTLSQATSDLNKYLSNRMPGSEGTISINSVNSIQVYTMGLVNKPGGYNLSATSKSLNGIIASGGFQNQSSLRDIDILRSGEKIANIDLYEFLINGDSSGDVYLRNGDTILIKARKNSATIKGAINRAAIYEFLPGESVQDLISFALGFSETADRTNISLTRRNSFGQMNTTQISSESDLLLKNGDLINIGSIDGEWIDKVKLTGSIRNEGIFGFDDEMKLGDLINLTRDLLNETYVGYITIKRFIPSTRTYSYISLDLLSQSRLNEFSLLRGDEIFVYSNQDIAFLNSELVISALDGSLDLSNVQSEMVSTDFSRVECLNPLRRFAGDDFKRSSLLKLQLTQFKNSEICTSFFESYPMHIPILINRSAPVSGEVISPGIYPVSEYVNASELLNISGGAIYQSSGKSNIQVGSILNNKIIIDSDINKQNLKFLGVNSKSASSSESYVTLVGEFRFPGKYKIDKTTTILDIYDQAGGLNETAFPAGAILTRQSIKEREEELLKRAERELNQIITTGITSGVIETVSEDTMGLISLLNQVSSIESIGRLIVDMEPLKLTSNKQENIFLQGGDTIYMPTFTNTVTISGSVLNPATVAYDPTKSLKQYISLAGGYTDFADQSQVYILLPNGKSFKASEMGIFRSNDYYIQPGSSIVIPKQTRPLSGLSLVEAVTPILANLSITMASIVSVTRNN